MARKLSIHVGVNTFESAAFPKDRQPTPLLAPELDARAMHGLAVDARLAATLLVGPAATLDNVSGALACASSRLQAGDLLVVSFSGHGGLHRDTGIIDPAARPFGATNTYPYDDPSGYDQSWYLHDGVLIDDAFYDLLVAFAPGVRIHVLSDSCYAGDILRLAQELAPRADDTTELLRGPAAVRGARPRDPAEVRGSQRRPRIRASALLSAASSETSTTATNASRGAFTTAVVELWADGGFPGDIVAFHEAVQARCAAGQVPDLRRYGASSKAFERSRPFGADGRPARRGQRRPTTRG